MIPRTIGEVEAYYTLLRQNFRKHRKAKNLGDCNMRFKAEGTLEMDLVELSR